MSTQLDFDFNEFADSHEANSSAIAILPKLTTPDIFDVGVDISPAEAFQESEELDPNAERIPFPHQKAFLESEIADQPKIALFWEMRLGKTMTALRWCKKHSLKKVLIVCPLSVIPTWETECSQEKLISFTFRSKDKSIFGCLSIMPEMYAITNYQALLCTDIGDVEKWGWEAVILDESPVIRKPSSKISKYCAQNFEDVGHKMILTGSPSPETLADYFQQMKFLHGSFCGEREFHRFKDRFFYSTNAYGNRLVCRPYRREEIEQYLKQHSVMLTRKDAGLTYCKKMYQTRFVDLPDIYREVYDAMERDLAFEDVATNWTIVAQNWLCQLAGGYPKNLPESDHKLDALTEMLVDGELSKEPTLIWHWFKQEGRMIQKYLRERHNLKIGIISGDVPDHERHQVRLDFFDGKYQHLVCQLSTAGKGLDFSHASTAIYYSNAWERIHRIQSEDRIIHPEKTEPLLIIDILARDTIDVDLLNALKEKEKRTTLFVTQVMQQFQKRVGAHANA